MKERALRAERSLHALLAHLPGSAAFVVDHDLRYSMADGEALGASGFAPGDLLGKTVREALGDALADHHEPWLRRALAGESFSFEHGAHGRWFLTRGAPLRDDAGAIYAALAFSHDITERREDEQRLRRSEERLRIALDAAALGTWDWDLGDDTIVWCERTRQIFGVGADDPVDLQAFESRLHPQDVARNRERTAEALASGAYANEFRVVDGNGPPRHVSSRGRLLRDEQGQARRMIGVVADLTLQRGLQNDMRRYAQRDAYRLRLEDALQALAEPGAIEGAAARTLAQALGADRVFYGEITDDGQTLVIAHDHAAQRRSIAGRHALSHFAWLAAQCRAGRRVVMADVDAHAALSSTERNALTALDARALLCLPLVKQGRLVAVLAALFDRVHAWSDDDLWWAETTAERTWAATLRARAEQALAASQQRYRDFIAQSSEGIWRLDIEPPLDTTQPLAQQLDALRAHGRFGEANDAMARMHGLADAHALIGRRLDATWPPGDASAQALLAALLLPGYRIVEAESVRRDAGGGERWFMHAIHGVVEGRWLSRLWGTQRDITERKLHEAALREADRRKDQFLATLSHELRNPLAPVRTAARLLSMPGADARQAQRAREVIERQTLHMSRLLDDLLDMARITQGKLVLKKERLPLQALVESAIEAARPAIDERQHRLDVTLPDETIWLDADPVRLAQVLSNLLTNAAVYTPPHGVIELAATLGELAAATPGSALVIDVRDNGAGIAAEALRDIFSLFVQAPSLPGQTGLAGREHGGMGIGLAVVKGLVELHGGHVEASSLGPGRGSAFRVTLPLPEQTVHVGGDLSAASAPASSGRRLLVADDNADAAEMLGSVLRLAGHEVMTAADGLEALQRVQSFHPHVALLDIGMPGLDGYALAERLRADPATQAVQLVALTGWGHATDRHRALAAGFDAHFIKPVDLDALTRWIDAHG